MFDRGSGFPAAITMSAQWLIRSWKAAPTTPKTI